MPRFFWGWKLHANIGINSLIWSDKRIEEKKELGKAGRYILKVYNIFGLFYGWIRQQFLDYFRVGIFMVQ